MTINIDLRPEVLAFAVLMEQRLREKDADKGVSWKSMSEHDLMVQGTSHAIRLEAELADDDLLEPERIKHAVDLANYCMMIADVAGALDIPIEPAAQEVYDIPAFLRKSAD